VADTSLSFDFDSLAESGERAANSIPVLEERLVEGLREGVEEAYEELITLYQHPVFNLVYRLLEEPAEASDVVQEVFLKVFRHIGSFRGKSSLKTWIYRIAVNEAHNHHRWFSRHRKREVGLESEDTAAGKGLGDLLRDPGRSPFELALRDETLELIEEALSKLKPVFREAVVLRDIEELSYEEIAAVLGVSLGTVKSRILRGREALRRELDSRLEREQGMYGWLPQPAGQD